MLPPLAQMTSQCTERKAQNVLLPVDEYQLKSSSAFIGPVSSTRCVIREQLPTEERVTLTMTQALCGTAATNSFGSRAAAGTCVWKRDRFPSDCYPGQNLLFWDKITHFYI